jgi:hypothetical protein
MLKQFLLTSAARHFGPRPFTRRELLDSVEQDLRQENLWQEMDDAPSQSTDPKSIGRANIDWSISALSSEHSLRHVGHNQWTLPARFWGLSGNGNGAVVSPTAVADKLQRLASVTGRANGSPIPVEALRRENLYRNS